MKEMSEHNEIISNRRYIDRGRREREKEKERKRRKAEEKGRGGRERGVHRQLPFSPVYSELIVHCLFLPQILVARTYIFHGTFSCY